MNCANCSASLRKKKLTYFLILSLLFLCYVLLGSFCRVISCLYAAVTWCLFFILSCFCLHYLVLPLKVNIKLFKARQVAACDARNGR